MSYFITKTEQLMENFNFFATLTVPLLQLFRFLTGAARMLRNIHFV